MSSSINRKSLALTVLDFVRRIEREFKPFIHYQALSKRKAISFLPYAKHVKDFFIMCNLDRIICQ